MDEQLIDDTGHDDGEEVEAEAEIEQIRNKLRSIGS